MGRGRDQVLSPRAGGTVERVRHETLGPRDMKAARRWELAVLQFTRRPKGEGIFFHALCLRLRDFLPRR